MFLLLNCINVRLLCGIKYQNHTTKSNERRVKLHIFFFYELHLAIISLIHERVVQLLFFVFFEKIRCSANPTGPKIVLVNVQKCMCAGERKYVCQVAMAIVSRVLWTNNLMA